MRRGIGAAALVLVTTAGALLVPGAAHAAAAEPTSFSMSGDPDDYITGGRSYDYAVDRGDQIFATLEDPGHIAVEVTGANGDEWTLDLAAPEGQELGPGDYPGATHWPFQGPTEPGLDVSGNGRGCGWLTGSFSISQLVVDAQGWIERLDATFEQHCEGQEAALRGSIHVEGPRPAPLDLGLAIAADGTVDPSTGTALIHGSVTCSEAVPVRLDGRALQLHPGDYPTSGSFDWFVVDCTPAGPTQWSAVLDPNGTPPFQAGDASIRATAQATDPGFGTRVEVETETDVTLTAAS